MKVLILGSGGREHALAWKIAQSKDCEKLYTAPGNPGTALVGENIDLNPEDFDAVAVKVLELQINLVVVGPEAPLVKGISDYFKSYKDLSQVLLIGPGKEGAKLEGSKDFAKTFMAKYNIPTAAYATFTKDTLSEAKAYLETINPPYVLKADGLAAGKGVVILNELAEAKKELDEMLGNAKFGEASARVVIENFLDGIELSVFVLTDGKDYVMLPSAKDYKRIGEGDTGLNTGGMGAVSPVPFADKAFMKKVEERVVKPTINGLHSEKMDYVGFVFIGLIKVGDEPFVIEYNVRMGDPETEVVMPRIKSDFLQLLKAAGEKKLAGKSLEMSSDFAATVMMVSKGYPENYEKGKPILGLEKIVENTLFHAGTREAEGQILTNGGRVLAATGMAKTLNEALRNAYAMVDQIGFDGKTYRKDIGKDLMQ
ncbi:phosphoribosylamine--glycine ligase [Cryomorpha ignava]|uniref:Phosphoribosylamine--glycine ligase n=1 Tax=Cryomorpha ignava TaxID=101383 RepID=A0A7K3WMT4_9FLAO|nr:phosphoribosylamine--glycine ligase [Cryomorpha ignava]NEN22005.1 phosphoribosylamine--glycine ligase [Cryomorpha ignava]